ncbi:MAG: STM3941 family protein [Hyphomicrobiaceae bacterium]
MAQELKIYQKKSKLLLGAIGCVVFAILAFFMLISGPSAASVFPPLRWPIVFYPISIAALLGALYFLFIATRGLLKPKPQVILANDGVTVDGFSGRFRADWHDLSGYALHTKALCVLKLKDPEAFVSRQPEGRPRVTARALTDRFGSPFLIDTANLATDMEAIRSVVDNHLQELKS